MTHPRLIESFNTHQLSDQKVRALVTARDRESDSIMSAIRANLGRTSGQLQHLASDGAAPSFWDI